MFLNKIKYLASNKAPGNDTISILLTEKKKQTKKTKQKQQQQQQQQKQI